MSRSRHPRKSAKLASAHRRKEKEWKKTSTWKPKERSKLGRKPKRRSKRKRSGD